MAKATISRNIDRVSVISAATTLATTPALQVRDQNFPAGDLAISSLTIRYDADITVVTPTRLTNGHIFYLNQLTVETDKHGKLVDGVDGLLMYVMNALDYGTPGQATALTATPVSGDAPACSWKVPFRLVKGWRPYDTHLDMTKSRMKVSTQWGPGNNLFTDGGAGTIDGLNQSIEAKILPGPLATGAENTELPTYIRSFEQKRDIITATETRRQISLPYGDGIWRRLVISQRNNSTGIEMSNVIAATAEISLYVNNVPVVDRRLFRDIQAENKLVYSLENLFTGVAVLDFDDDEQERVFDMLWANTLDAGNMYLYIDVTTQTNASILLGYDRLKLIPPAAQRG